MLGGGARSGAALTTNQMLADLVRNEDLDKRVATVVVVGKKGKETMKIGSVRRYFPTGEHSRLSPFKRGVATAQKDTTGGATATARIQRTKPIEWIIGKAAIAVFKNNATVQQMNLRPSLNEDLKPPPRSCAFPRLVTILSHHKPSSSHSFHKPTEISHQTATASPLPKMPT